MLRLRPCHSVLIVLVSFTVPCAAADLPRLGPYVEYTAPDTARVHWITREPSPTCLEYGLAGPDARHSPTYTLGGARRGSLEHRIEQNAEKRHHVCTLSGLQAQRIYAYRIRFTHAASKRVTDVYPLDLRLNYTAAPLVPPLDPYERMPDRQRVLARARRLLTASGSGPGIALVCGLTDGQLATALARESRLTVIGIDNDPQRTAQIRNRLHQAGVYGGRLSIRLVDRLERLALPSDFANLLVCEQTSATPPLAAGLERELRRILRPQGGCLWLPGATRPVTKQTKVGSWTHQYADAGNTANSREPLGGASRTDQLQVQWIGKPGADFGIDRNPRMPAPLAVSGKLFHQGMNRIAALDSYNGTVLWSLEIPALRRVNLPRDAGNWCTDEDALYVVVRDHCWIVDHNDGTLRGTVSLPEDETKTPYEWGTIARHDTLLIGSAVREGTPYRNFWGKATWFDQTGGFGTGKVCSDSLFAHDVSTEKHLWQHRRGLIVNATVSIAGGRIFFVENRNPAVLAQTDRRLNDENFWSHQYLVALDARSGRLLWEQPLDISAGIVVTFMACTEDAIVLCTSAEGKYHLYTFETDTGQARWQNAHSWPSDNHGGHMQHPVVYDDRVFLEPCGYDLADGRRLTEAMGRHEGCATYCGLQNALLYRGTSRRIAMWDIQAEQVSTWYNLRPSCWLSTIAANGMVLLPEGGGGCSCGNWLETSLALAPLPGQETQPRP